ncbi:MAG: alanyl-tRNA editing protein [Pirellulales bacterium]|nr:alanyl-tRNA editing protein [Pirellulales bacterium]
MNNLYLTDAYRREMDTLVEEVRTVKKKTAVSLVDNIFYPGGGGQPPDSGSILLPSGETVPVCRVLKLDGKVFACLASAAEVCVNDNVRTILDWEKRYATMRYHTGAHVLMGAIRRSVDGYVPEGIAIADDVLSCTVRFSGQWQPSDTAIREIEERANQQIQRCLKVEVLTYESLSQAIDQHESIYRGPSSFSGPVRVIVINEWDANPCGGTHVRSTEEVGQIRLTDFGEDHIVMQFAPSNSP